MSEERYCPDCLREANYLEDKRIYVCVSCDEIFTERLALTKLQVDRMHMIPPYYAGLEVEKK